MSANSCRLMIERRRRTAGLDQSDGSELCARRGSRAVARRVPPESRLIEQSRCRVRKTLLCFRQLAAVTNRDGPHAHVMGDFPVAITPGLRGYEGC